jgi:hypothetical protein
MYVVEAGKQPPAAIGLKFGIGEPNPEPGRLLFSVQEISYMASMAVQIVTLIMLLIALSLPGGVISALARNIMVIELGIVGWSLTVYIAVATLYFVGAASVSISARYIIYMVAAPARGASLAYFSGLEMLNGYCINPVEFGNVGGALRTVSLLAGFLLGLPFFLVLFTYEIRHRRGTKLLNRASACCCIEEGSNGGFVFAFFPFVAITALAAAIIPSTVGPEYMVCVIAQFFAWAWYAVTAYRNQSGLVDEASANNVYNGLDVLAWCTLPIVVSVIVFRNPYICSVLTN